MSNDAGCGGERKRFSSRPAFAATAPKPARSQSSEHGWKDILAEPSSAQGTSAATRLARSFRYAWDGLGHLTHSQQNWRIHVLAATLVTALAIVLQVSTLELALLALAIGLVLASEAMNTAIEAAVDVASQGRFSIAAKHAKDSAAAGVLIAAASAVAVGLAILGPRLARLLDGP
jgi:diacylglycerol kinase